jgi:cob(I)alamin adenosyltransferase
MGKKPKIYTKTGDDGTTGLLGGSRIKKSDQRLEAYGTVDELNAYLGLIRSFELEPQVIELLLFIQKKLFIIGAKLASDEKGAKFTENIGCLPEDIKRLEDAIDLYEESLPGLTNFIFPGGEQVSAYCHIARTVCRRAERQMIRLSEHFPLPKYCLEFINRLSDYLFVLSRKVANDKHSTEICLRLK